LAELDWTKLDQPLSMAFVLGPSPPGPPGFEEAEPGLPETVADDALIASLLTLFDDDPRLVLLGSIPEFTVKKMKIDLEKKMAVHSVLHKDPSTLKIRI